MKRSFILLISVFICGVSLAQSQKPEKINIYLNGSIFRDVTDGSGFEHQGYGKCIVMGDFDNDGDLDIYCSVVYSYNKLFQNEGGLKFKDMSREYRVDDLKDTHGIVMADFDNNGYLDIFCANNLEALTKMRGEFDQPNSFYLGYDEGFVESGAAAHLVGGPNYSCGVTTCDVNNDGLLDLYVAKGGYRKGLDCMDSFYINNVNGTFTDSAVAMGIVNSGNGYCCVYQGTLECLGGMSLQVLLDYHRNYLMETYIPNWNRGVDWKYGGFANEVIPGQEPNFERKSMYYQARAVWVFSYLYNHISNDVRHLEAAAKSRDFLIKHALTDDFRWVSFVTRQGKPLSEPLDHYGDIYMVQGLTELYKATNDKKDLNLAIQTAHSVMDRLVSSSYQHVDAHTSALEPGTRRLASWQHFLGALTPLLRLQRDPAIERIARYCVRVICEHHWLPEYGVLLELLDDHFHIFTFDAPNWGEIPNLRSVNGWHSIQACWMVMDEALRVMHYPTFQQGVEMGFSTLEKCYVDGKGITSLNNPEAKPSPELDPWRALDDVLVFCLMVLEHIHEPMAISYYNKCFELYNSKPENFTPQCLLHVPRRFFYSIEILTRMIENGGKISGSFG